MAARAAARRAATPSVCASTPLQLLAAAAAAAHALTAAELEPLALTPRTWRVLATLAGSAQPSQIELAHLTATDPSTLVYLLDQLEERGLVERVRDEVDRRVVRIHLTATGDALRQRALVALAAQAGTLLEALTPAEQRQLVELLRRLIGRGDELRAVDGSRL